MVNIISAVLYLVQFEFYCNYTVYCSFLAKTQTLYHCYSYLYGINLGYSLIYKLDLLPIILAPLYLSYLVVFSKMQNRHRHLLYQIY